MSQRALKKRELSLKKQEKETHQIYLKQPQSFHGQKPKYTQRANATSISQIKHSTHRSNSSVSKQKCISMPNLTITNDTMYRNQFVRSQSESDLSCMSEANALVNAKSEFHLKSIASSDNNYKPPNKSISNQSMNPSNSQNKRLADQSRHRIADSTASSSSNSSTATVDVCDAVHFRVPIVGYEVMEERARFTVFKLRIEDPFRNKCWLVLRRYTDFQRLNNKLKSTIPHLLPLTLPRKKLFGDNFNTLFLNNRVQGLQLFIDTIMSNETLRNSQPARDFFNLDEPPSYSENIEECRAIFEAQEETINHLKAQLRTKEEIIRSMQQQLSNEIEKNRALSKAITFSYENCGNCSKKFDELMSVLNKSK